MELYKKEHMNNLNLLFKKHQLINGQYLFLINHSEFMKILWDLWDGASNHWLNRKDIISLQSGYHV